MLWNEGDPTTGINFQTFKQSKQEPNLLGYCPQSNSIYVKLVDSLPAHCYSYQYLSGLCILVKYTENYDKNQAVWEFKGGCFENGEIAHYSQAEIGKSYSINQAVLEVR